MVMFDSLAEILIEIQLLREEQWQEVRRRLTPEVDLQTVLDRVQELTAWWSAGAPVPALTAYQRKRIQRLFEKGRLARLKGALRRGDYLILEELGEGGMGIVYKAWDFQEGCLVALKQIKKVSGETYRRFRREARIQKRLCHPNVVRFIKLARVRSDTLLIQEYIEGRTLEEEVKARGPIPWQEAVCWLLDVLGALEHAHRLKIIHRDLKPSNIILHQQPSGTRAKLLDLGLAKCLDPSSMSQTTTRDAVTVGDALLGTFEYMAPEQWRGAEEIVPASDIYSLGCTFFYVLTGGRPPFVADSLVAYCHAHTNTPPPRLNTAQPAIPASLDALMQQMLSKAPAQRGTPTRLIKQFRKLLSPTAPDRPPRSLGRRRISSQPTPLGPPRRNPLPSHTPAPKDPMRLPRLEAPPADDRFRPFADASEVNVSGVRNFLRAFLVSRGLFRRGLFLIFLALAVVGMLLLCLWL
jgi:serine/threonine-protein kinase